MSGLSIACFVIPALTTSRKEGDSLATSLYLLEERDARRPGVVKSSLEILQGGKKRGAAEKQASGHNGTRVSKT